MAKEQAFSIPTVKEWSLQIFCGITLRSECKLQGCLRGFDHPKEGLIPGQWWWKGVGCQRK